MDINQMVCKYENIFKKLIFKGCFSVMAEVLDCGLKVG